MDSLGLWKASSEVEEIGDVTRKTDQVEPNYSNSRRRYEKLGSAGIKGSLYQIDLLMLVLLNGMQKVKHWRLSTEDKRAAQLDDLIFEHLPSESTILLQAKHKEDERKEVTYKDLMSVNKNSEFSLPKYFFSYQELKTKFKVQNVIICTNLELDKKSKIILKEESVDPDSVLYFEGAENICYAFTGCSLPELKPSIMTYQAKNLKDKEAIITDDDINDFLKHLKFFSNCLGRKIVDKVMQQTISQVKFSESLNSKTIQTHIQKKMTDWFKEKKGRYLTEMEAKAFFCEMRSNKYCEELKLYDICFKRSNLPLILQTQQITEKKGETNRLQNDNEAPVEDPKQILHIIPDKEYMLNVVKTYRALPTHHKEKTLFVNPDETVEVRKEIIDAFAVQHYTILVMVCPNTIEETIAGEMCDRVLTILDAHKYKHVILIAEERNYLATRLKHANINYYEVMTDNITFADLEETTRKEFKRKKLINFQGYTMSLEELFTQSTRDDLDQIVNSEMLIKFARGDKTEVGLELPHPDSYYISRSFNRSDQNISEEDLWGSTETTEEKVVLISDSAGMGKSSVLTSLAVSIKRDNPHLWVVRFDLNNYTNVMRTTLEEGRKSVGIMELLNSQETSKLKCEFGEKLFTTQKRLVLMLDGVDEISPAYTELVINLISDSLAQVNLAKMFVTARPHMLKDLNRISESHPFTFEPFSQVNQIDFLIRYWMETLDLQDDAMKDKCKIFAEALITKISAWMGDSNDFAGIPLQTRMLAEVFLEPNEIGGEDHDWEGCKEFLSSHNEEPKLSTRIDLAQLYEMFINKKCDIFIKKNNPSRHPVADEALKLQLKDCQKYHRALALEEILDSDNELQFFTCHTDVEWPIPSSLADNFLYRIGIVQIQEGNFEFLHRTIAESFVTECILIELERTPVNEEFQEFFMNSILIGIQFHVIRAFLNCRMPNVLHLMENNFCSYFCQNPISERSLSRYFNVFAKGDCVRILECFIKCVDKEQREIISETVNNVYLMYDTIYFTVRYGHLNVLKLLLELNETYNKGKDSHKEFLQKALMTAAEYNLKAFEFLLCQVDENGKNILGRSALHKAALMCRLEEVQSLVEEGGADINIKDYVLGWTALCEAVLMGRLEVVRFLVLDAGVDMNVKDNQGRTALHYAALKDAFEILKFLAKEGVADVNVRDNDGQTALHGAVFIGNLEIVKFLVEEAEADINIKDIKAKTALHTAVDRRKLQIIKCLVGAPGADINVKNIDGSTALHAAVYRGALEIVEFLVKEAGADVNIEDNDGNTALHAAVNRSELEMVKCLTEETGADVNIKNNYGETALYLAVYWDELEIVKILAKGAKADIDIKNNDGNTALSVGELETVKWLMEETATDINIKNNDGQTALHRAVCRGKLEIIKCLVEGGADINTTDNYGNTALHVAISRNQLEIVKCLVEAAGVDVNIKNNYGQTALHRAVHYNELLLEIVQYLVGEAGARINIKDDDGKTALHSAVDKGQLELVKCLVEEAGEDTNIKDKDGNTALHVATYGGKLKIVKCLVAEPGTDINIINNVGNTPLHLAVQMGELETVKCLVVEPGVDINTINNEGNTALHTAVHRGELEIVKYLVERAGADTNIKDENGKTALRVAADQGHWNIVKVLSNSSRWVMFKMKTNQFFGRKFPR